MSKDKVATTSPVAWHISTYSVNGSGQCVEAGPSTNGIHRFAVRDSQHRSNGTLIFDTREWAALLASLE
ncbi:DUF397 domain-containing protein [Nocardiopsis sp. CNT312]|uniref:DUF397 domain-containing protein n=1 Tax=Nocardiopsis sp. CNT312 TaxID=1137268 RepID=UPI0004BA9EA5|nr:DUF397 domain-containing protein [Nocardiopsis sp. CNT312]